MKAIPTKKSKESINDSIADVGIKSAKQRDSHVTNAAGGDHEMV